MASVESSYTSSKPQELHASSSNILSIKAFTELNGNATIPSTYYSLTEPRDDVADELAASIPILDFSRLASQDPDIHVDAVRELSKACKEWGFFMMINHGVSDSLMEDIMKKSLEFHNLPLEEKTEFSNKSLSSTIRYGTSSPAQGEKFHYWRDYLRTTTFPEFSFPHKPSGFKEVAFEYTRKIRGVVRNLLRGISESLGLQSNAILEYTGFDLGLQKFQVNLYPPCPEPDRALGLPPHTDNGFVTILIQNEIIGLQVKYDGKWVNVNPPPKCLVVIVGDQLEAVSNGRYSSVWHRAVLNEKDTRVTITLTNGPELGKEIGPSPKLLENEEPLFKSITYRDYMELQRKARFAHGRALDELRLNPSNQSL